MFSSVFVRLASSAALILVALLFYNFRYSLSSQTRSDVAQPAQPTLLPRSEQLEQPDQAPQSAKPANARVDGVYRVRGVPRGWVKKDLEKSLKQQYEESNFVVGSLALEYDGKSQTATMKCPRGTKLPETLELPGTPTCLMADQDFYGVTTLYTPPEEDHKLDIIVITGLGGHAYGSWKCKGDDYMWVRDALPTHLTEEGSQRPMARVILYGYESKVPGSSNFSNISTFAQKLRRSLNVIGKKRKRPFIFLAHSLGGLIIKEAIISLYESQSGDDQDLLQRIYGIAFFGVPHQGMENKHLLAMADNGPNTELVASLSNVNSHFLICQGRLFPKALQAGRHTELFYFFETLKSPTAQYDQMTSKWIPDGPEEFLVSQYSATAGRPEDNSNEFICGLTKNHSNLVKFTERDLECAIVLETIHGLAKRALQGSERPPNPDVKWMVPYVENAAFVGREGYLENIKNHFGLGDNSRKRKSGRLAIHGLGGVGKTQIALSFAHWVNRICHQTSVFWVHGSSQDRFRQAYALIADECNIEGRNEPSKDVLELVRDYLSRKHSYRWIMLIDNVDDQDVLFPLDGSTGLKKYIPECEKGSILLTTRNAKVGHDFMRGCTPLEVETITAEESVLMVRHTLDTRSVSAQEALDLSGHVENLPLVLMQALAYIKQNEKPINEYIDLLKTSGSILLRRMSQTFESHGRHDELPNAVTKSWIISFEQIEKVDPLAAEFLSLICLYDQQAIPRELLTQYQLHKGYATSSDEQERKALLEMGRDDSIGTLKAYSFVTETRNGTLDLHRLVRLVTRRWLTGRKRLDSFSPLAILALNNHGPRVSWETMSVWRRLLPHAKAVESLPTPRDEQKEQKLNRIKIQYRIGYYFFWKHQYEDAECFVEAAYHGYSEVLGPESEDTLFAVQRLLQIYGFQRNPSKWETGRELGDKESKRSEKALGRNHDATLRITARLADLYLKLKDAEKAESLLNQVLQERLQDWELRHDSETWRVMHNLASVCSTVRNWSKAEDLIKQILAKREELGDKSQGTSHPDYSNSLASLAAIHSHQGRFSEAQELFEKAVKINTTIYGSDHARTLDSSSQLASTYWQQGKFESARDTLKQVWTRHERNSGDIRLILFHMSNYAICLHRCGQRSEAIKVMGDCWNRQKELLGETSGVSRRSRTLLDIWEKEEAESKLLS